VPSFPDGPNLFVINDFDQRSEIPLGREVVFSHHFDPRACGFSATIANGAEANRDEVSHHDTQRSSVTGH
jgi:hypothetical protein